MELQPAEINKVKEQIRNLDRRDWHRWSVALLSLLVAGGGVLGFLSVRGGAAGESLNVPLVAVVGFLYSVAVAVAAFNIYALASAQRAEKVNVALLLETLENQVGRLQGMVDPLTRVYNRFCLEETLQKEIARAERTATAFAIIVVDMNKFKEINDEFGHLMGDFALAETGQILRSCVRGSDVIIRYGGDEFLLVLTETDRPGAEVVASRIQARMKDWNQKSKVVRFELSASIGVSVWASGRKLPEMIAEADQRMYDMKRGSGAGSAAATPRAAETK